MLRAVSARPEPRTVLLVDDDEDFRQVVRMKLEDEGFNVVGEAANGAEAVAAAARLNPSILVLDNQMPYLEGPQVHEHVETVCPHTNIVVFSGSVTERPEWAHNYLPKDRLPDLPDLLIRLESEPTGSAEG